MRIFHHSSAHHSSVRHSSAGTSSAGTSTRSRSSTSTPVQVLLISSHIMLSLLLYDIKSAHAFTFTTINSINNININGHITINNNNNNLNKYQLNNHQHHHLRSTSRLLQILGDTGGRSNHKDNDNETSQTNPTAATLSRRKILNQIMTVSAITTSVTTASIVTNTCTGTTLVANAIYENAPVVDSLPTKLSNGITYQDLRIGGTSTASSNNNNDDDDDNSNNNSNAVVQEGKRVNIQWVIKRSNGYFIDASSNNDGIPFIFVVGTSSSTTTENNRPIVGLDQGIIGMKVGGIRRIVIPLEYAYVKGVEDNKPGPVPNGFGPKQRVRRVMEMMKDDIPGESIVLDVKLTRIQ